MQIRDLVIGLDSSTTACKAVIFDRQGTALAVGRAPLPMLRPKPAWHEQPAEAWWEAAVSALRQVTSLVDPARIAALSIAPQRETFVVAGADGQPLENAMLWMDERCRDLLPEIDQLYGKERIHQETGKPLSANLSLGKLFWLRVHRPELFRQIAWVLDVHAYLTKHLTGRFVTSWGCADPMGLFDMRPATWTQGDGWNTSLIEAIGLHVDQFPEAVPPGTVIGEISAEAAGLTGLARSTLLVAGLGDGQAAGLGMLVAQPGEAYLNLGTAVVSGAFSARYLVDPAFRTMYGGIPGSYILETVLLGGTYTISWFIEKFFTETRTDPNRAPEEILEREASQVPPGAFGLMLVPYWNSAMNPYWDAGATGMMIGWRGVHGRAHFYRAILEGIAFEQRLHTTGVESALQQPVERLIAVGGGARSDLWRGIIADVTRKPVYRADAPEATALGAGVLAAAGAGLFPGPLEAARAMTRAADQPVFPDPARAKIYGRLYEEIYQHLFPAVQKSMDRLADLTVQDDSAEEV